uniref:Uncharacterized protein n=1 Tax=Anguilla anguilla TaxID=7936 RepID=A0A0E9VWT4_ANGAN
MATSSGDLQPVCAK